VHSSLTSLHPTTMHIRRSEIAVGLISKRQLLTNGTKFAAVRTSLLQPLRRRHENNVRGASPKSGNPNRRLMTTTATTPAAEVMLLLVSRRFVGSSQPRGQTDGRTGRPSRFHSRSPKYIADLHANYVSCVAHGRD